MYNLDVFDKARTLYSVKELPFLTKMRQELASNPRYQGLRILHNVPLTLATAFKIELLALGGAEVIATSIKDLPAEERAVELLKAANITVLQEHTFTGFFDLHLDCCAELIGLPPPQRGAVELTQTGSVIYRQATLSYPLLSVDDSPLKIIETFFGTGDGFIRAFQNQVGIKAMFNKPYIVFGYGKVSRGIVYQLKKFSQDITVIDTKCPSVLRGVKFIAADNRQEIRHAISGAYAAITATGVSGLMTHYYHFFKADFGDCLLANMGAADEFGENFSEDEILFNKKPLNFSLVEPTAFRYLDPIFYAHNLGIDLILSTDLANGYHPFPPDLAQSILQNWSAIYQDNVEEALAVSFDEVECGQD